MRKREKERERARLVEFAFLRVRDTRDALFPLPLARRDTLIHRHMIIAGATY